jgi:repressor LexA
MEPLTEKQQRILGFIEDRLKDNSPPSQREIARHFGLAQNAVYQLVGYLKKKGYIVNSGGHRKLRLSEEYLNKRRQTAGIPVIGRVAAGEPILAQENIERYIDLGEMFGSAMSKFILKVTGDSMVDEGIMDGDHVVVQSCSEVENGRVGVVLLGDEVTIKRIYVRRGQVALEPANKAAGYKTRYVGRRSGAVRIIGKVVGCFRKL